MAFLMQKLIKAATKLKQLPKPDLLRPIHTPKTCVPSFSTAAPTEYNVLWFLDHEIKYEYDNASYCQIPHSNIQYQVKDRAGEQWIVLNRKYGGENIRVEATILGLDDGQDAVADDEDVDVPCNICLSVTVSKQGFSSPMVLGCFVYPEEIVVESVSIFNPGDAAEEKVYKGPGLKAMKGDLQKAFREFLEERGIDHNFTGFLYEFMLNKTRREYVKWLERVKVFIEK